MYDILFTSFSTNCAADDNSDLILPLGALVSHAVWNIKSNVFMIMMMFYLPSSHRYSQTMHYHISKR